MGSLSRKSCRTALLDTISLTQPFTVLQNDNIMISGDFFKLTAPRCPGIAAGAVSLIKSHDIVILSFCNLVKGQAKCSTICSLDWLLDRFSIYAPMYVFMFKREQY